MILLETNVIPEPWKPSPDSEVLTWLDAQAIETLFISAISIADVTARIYNLDSLGDRNPPVLRRQLKQCNG